MTRKIARSWMGLVVLALGTVPPVMAQEVLPSPGAGKVPPPPSAAESMPAPAAEPLLETLCDECSKGSLFVHGEYLLLQPRRRALDFAIVDPTNDGKAQGSIESLAWESDSGFRVGGGYRLPADEWEIGAYYTYLHSSNRRLLAAPDGGTLYATLTHPGFVDAVDRAAGFTNLNYDVLDVEIGQHYAVSDSCTLWFSGGGRFAWINQNLNVIYDGQSAFQSQVSSPVRFDGGGVRIAGEACWKLWKGFGFSTRASGSLLAGDFRTTLVETNNAGASVISNVTDRYRKVVPVTELGVGLSWQGETVRMRVGYEIIDWFGLVDSPDFVHDFTNKLSHRTSDLSLDGLSVEVEVGF